MKGRRTRFPFLALVLFLVFLSSGAVAQVLTGTIKGSVVDPQDLVIPGAKVTVVDLGTGREYTTTTDDSGSFTVTNLPNGFYRVSVEMQNFAKFTAPRVQVDVSATAKVVAKLELARTGTEVVVRAEQAVVQTETSEVKYGVDRRQIMNLQLATRNPMDLVKTLPGVVTPTSSGIGDAFVHGLRGNSTNISLDGINIADNFVKTSPFFGISSPIADSIGQFSVSTGAIGVDGGFGAAQVTIRTQRGENDLHGSLYWYQRTSAFNANTFLNNASGQPRPFQLQNRIGAHAGGPVYFPKLYNGRKRSWWFFSYEAFREPASRPRTRTVLAQSARQGLFTYTPPCGGPSQPACPTGFTPGPRTVNLLSLGRLGNTGATPAINSAVMNFYNNLVPNPNTDVGCSGDTINIRCFVWNVPGMGSQNRYALRGDHQLTKNHAIEFAFNQQDFFTLADFLNNVDNPFPKSSAGGQTSRRQVFSWALHSTFGTNKTNEARAGYQRAPVIFSFDEKFADTAGFQLNFPAPFTNPIAQTGRPQGRNTPVRQAVDNFAWTRGRHGFRFGGEYRQILANNFNANVVVPRVNLGSNSSNLNDIADSSFVGSLITAGDLARAQAIFNAVTGLIGSTSQAFNHTSPTSGFVRGAPRVQDPIQHNFAFYFQDNFKVWSNFMLQYGVRWEYQGVFDYRNGLLLQPVDGVAGLFGPAGLNNHFNVLATPAATDTLLNLVGGRNGKPLYGRDLNNFAPFLGFAWDPSKNGKTAIRGGITSHYTQDGFTAFTGNVGVNDGVFSTRSNTVATGVFSATNAAANLPAVPTASFPVSQRANFAASSASQLWMVDPGLRTPYVIEWTLGIQREIPWRMTVEARYVGNHAVKQYRAWGINELNLLNNPFRFGGNSVANVLTEFKNAQNNLNLCSANRVACTGSATGALRFDFRSNVPGSVRLPILEALFQLPVPFSSGFGSSTFRTNLSQNQIGAMFNALRTQDTYRANRLANFPLNFFVPQPFGSVFTGLQDNSGWSYYHGLELEVRRRFSSGLFFQANYTFSKVLTDQRFLTAQDEFQSYRTLLDRKLDKNRAAFDVPQSFAANYIYELPFGKGKWLGGKANMFLDKLIGGWQVQGLTRVSAGAPFTITSNRQVTGSLVGETAVLRNMTPKQLQGFIGVFKVPGGVFWLDPKSGLITVTTTSTGTASTVVFCTTGQTTPCFDHPGVNELGSLPFLGFNGPRFWTQDFSIIKRTGLSKISEKFNFDIRFEFFNAFNHPNFANPGAAATAQVDNAKFGQLVDLLDSSRGGGVNARTIQWAIRVNF